MYANKQVTNGKVRSPVQTDNEGEFKTVLCAGFLRRKVFTLGNSQPRRQANGCRVFRSLSCELELKAVDSLTDGRN